MRTDMNGQRILLSVTRPLALSSKVRQSLEGSASIFPDPATLHQEAGGFLMPLLCVGPSVQKCHRSVKIVDMSDMRTDQSMRTTLFLLNLVRCVLTLSS